MLGTLVPRDGKVLVLVNGAYGDRIAKICDYHGRSKVVQKCPENQPVSVTQLDQTLSADSSITHVVAVHCETTTGILNPVKDISEVVKRHGRSLLLRREEDVNGDGEIDVVSFYVAGKLRRRQVRDPEAPRLDHRCPRLRA